MFFYLKIFIDIIRITVFYYLKTGSSLKKKNRVFRKRYKGDYLPPLWAIYMVSGTYDMEAFIKNGETGFNNIEKHIEDLGIGLNNKLTILDWGAGIGRIAHFWKEKYSNMYLYVSDYNPFFTFLLKKHVKSNKVIKNNLLPPLDILDKSVDVVYAISVFTHLKKEEISLWLNEIYRILRKDGIFLFSVQGKDRVKELPEDFYKKFNFKGFIEIGKEEGSNYFASFHSKEFIENLINKDKWEIKGFYYNGAIDARQDLWIISKK